MYKQAKKIYPQDSIWFQNKTEMCFCDSNLHAYTNQQRGNKPSWKKKERKYGQIHRWLKPEWDGMSRCEPHKHLSAWALVHWQIPQMLAASKQHAPFFHRPSNQRRRQHQQQLSGGAASVRLHSETKQSPLHWHTTLSQVGCVSHSPSQKHTHARERMQSSGGFSSVARVDGRWVSVTARMDIASCVWYWSGGGCCKSSPWSGIIRMIKPSVPVAAVDQISLCVCACVRMCACLRSEWAGRVQSSSEVKLSVWMLFLRSCLQARSSFECLN